MGEFQPIWHTSTPATGSNALRTIKECLDYHHRRNSTEAQRLDNRVEYDGNTAIRYQFRIFADNYKGKYQVSCCRTEYRETGTEASTEWLSFSEQELRLCRGGPELLKLWSDMMSKSTY